MNNWPNETRYQFTLSKTPPLSQEDISILTAPIPDLQVGGKNPIPSDPITLKSGRPHKIVDIETTDPYLMARQLNQMADMIMKEHEKLQAQQTPSALDASNESKNGGQ